MITITKTQIMNDAQTQDDIACERILRYAHSYLCARVFNATYADDVLTITRHDDHADDDELRDEIHDVIARDAKRVDCVDDQSRIAYECASSLLTYL
jgi:hypothetical protein